MKNEEFFVGYNPQTPPGLARLLKLLSVGLIIAAMFVAGLLAGRMPVFARAHYAFGEHQSLSGVLLETPVPSLLIERPGGPGRMPGFERLLLVGPGKWGVAEQVQGLHGAVVQAQGEFIERDGLRMFKLLSRSVQALDNSEHERAAQQWLQALPAAEPQGKVRIRGEIIDSQCYFGVMKPGYGKPHRACALRCLSGGVPPLLHGQNAQGRWGYYLVLGPDGTPITRELLPKVADVVVVEGELIRYPQWNVIRTMADAVQRATETGDTPL